MKSDFKFWGNAVFLIVVCMSCFFLYFWIISSLIEVLFR